MIDILFEDNHCLAVNKPAGLLAQGDSSGAPSLLDEARAYLKVRYQKPGNVFVGLVHRLDRPTSGAIVLARTSKAASRLSAQFRDSKVQKTYRAIVEKTPPEESGEWSDTLWKDEGENRVEVVPPGTPGARDARLAYRIVGWHGKHAVLELRPTTGRGHQLRVQLSSRGIPIVGDRKYGATSLLIGADGHPRIALHAQQLVFAHPTREEAISVVAPVPEDWPERGTAAPSESSRPTERPDRSR